MTAGKAYGTVDVIAPKAITLPSVNTTIAGPTGAIGMSGASLVFYNGTAWKIVTAS